ncbi:MAG: FHA domain-containing protein [Deltaproteobacteria bacterium]|nr:MAG: FHA domain-containing protein [Deltaproteobacteria bacterium]
MDRRAQRPRPHLARRRSRRTHPGLRGRAMTTPLPGGERFGAPQPDTHDAVVRLRQWGTDRFWFLPHAPLDGSGEWLIGTSGDCAFRVTDRLSARKHARVAREGERWWVRDLGTPHGIRRDGMRCREFVITPGVEIGIGATVLVAETAHSVALRGFVQRILGWGALPSSSAARGN